MKKTFKITILFCIFFHLFFVTNSFPQSIVVTSKKIVYKRPEEETVSKKTFTIVYPRIKASTPVLSKKIEGLLSYEKAFPYFSLSDQVNGENSLSNAYYKVNYNKNGILGITLFYETVTAYPSIFSKNVVINTATGTRVFPADVFTDLSRLAAKVRIAQQKEIIAAQAEYKHNSSRNDDSGDWYFQNAKFTIAELNNFTVSNKGITFNYDYEFPHAALALQPPGRYFYSWMQLKPFIKRDGLLARFIR